jgi:putative ABC transport system ATP-binding protein
MSRRLCALPEPVALTCRGVTRTYRSPGGSVEALHAVDADFPAGAICAVVGRSGCGKSTLLRLIAGLDVPDEGAIRAGRVDVTGLDARRLRRYRRATATFLAQRAAANLVPHLTVAEQLGAADGLALAVMLGLEPRLHARAEELSGGEQARAALAGGLSRRTPLLVVDEPTAELDRDHATHVVDVLRRAAATGRTVIVATHDPDLIAAASVRLELTPRRTDAGRSAPSRRSQGKREAVLAFRGVTKRYDGAPVVDDASLELAAGELGVLLGRSGSGKSTLLMVAGGWLRADAGEAVVPGAAWTETAYLPQRFGLLQELTAAENVALPLRLAGAAGDVGSLLDRLAVSDVAERLPAEASVGQQQRIALARTLALRPAALLADEPASHQDACSADLVWRALRAACDEGTACLVATHDEAVVHHADRLWRIADGRVRRS